MGIVYVYAKLYNLSWKKDEMLEFWYISPNIILYMHFTHGIYLF